MIERWKYQIKTGGLYGLGFTIFMGFIDLSKMSFTEAFLSKHFLLRLISSMITGVLILGYVFWKSKKSRKQ